MGTVGEQELMFADGQQIARTRDEFIMIDRRMKEVRRARFERAQPEASLFVDGDDYNGDFRTVVHCSEAPDELGTIEVRHLVVGDDEIGRMVLQPIKGFEGIAKGVNLNLRFDRRRKLREDVPVRYTVVDYYYYRHQPNPLADLASAPDGPIDTMHGYN
jgi:hypothetical protein